MIFGLEWKYNLETYTLLRGKAQGDYQGKYKPEANRAGVSTYGTTVPELINALCTIWYCLTTLLAHKAVIKGVLAGHNVAMVI